VSLDIAEGEFVTFLGPSGSGKSTTLYAIAGFLEPTRGDVLLEGRSILGVPSNKRNIGMVFQRYTLFPHMSVLENIAFPLKMRGIPRAEREERARTALATVRLAQHGDRRPAQLSGGQQQRVALARAIVYRPQVLLMDEPLSALDKNLREEMQIEIKHLQRELGITVIFVTHDQSEALTMADRIAVLNHGVLQQVGAPRELYDRPATEFMAGFIGESNFWSGIASAAVAPGAIASIRLAGGGMAGAIAATALREGEKVVVAVRPERVRLLPVAAELPARVEETIYAGNVTTIVLRTGGPSLRARLPAGSGIAEPVPGVALGVGWEPEHARAYAATS
jgi:ABC-type Fe3+/spermidine/putrescine transport system ATPase subunit